jgi:hypothetical protein
MRPKALIAPTSGRERMDGWQQKQTISPKCPNEITHISPLVSDMERLGEDVCCHE